VKKLKLLSAGVVVVRQTQTGCRYLLLRAYRHWDFPKGLVEPGESPLMAARREVLEEAGFMPLDFCWGEQFKETEPYGQGKMARYYVARTNQSSVELPVSSELGRPEHDEFRWVSYQQAVDLLVERLRRILTWAHQLTRCEESDSQS
jgi:8-oxo-dGTP pyrophosphatase MutT (NUDIX family)